MRRLHPRSTRRYPAGLALTVAGLVALLAAVPSRAAQPPSPPRPNDSAPPVPGAGGVEPLALQSLRKSVQGTLDRLDRDLAAAARRMSRTGLTGSAARAVLLEICKKHPFVFDTAAVNLAGRMITIEPPEHRNFEGSDISGQSQVKALHRYKRPFLSRTFRAVEGFDAIDVEYPIFGPGGKLIGSVSALIRPERLLGEHVRKALAGFPVEGWAFQRDGRVLFDVRPDRIGKNVFRDAAYRESPQVVNVARKVVSRGDGAARYRAAANPGEPERPYTARWGTVLLHGAEWRLVLVKPETGSGAPIADAKPAELAGKLRNLARQPALAARLAAGDEAGARALFKAFVEQNPGVYSLQWVDAKGVTRFGHPQENSLRNYDFHSGRTADDAQFVQAVDGRKEVRLELPLIEGGRGEFLLCPVTSGGTYLGMVYTLRRLGQ